MSAYFGGTGGEDLFTEPGKKNCRRIRLGELFHETVDDLTGLALAEDRLGNRGAGRTVIIKKNAIFCHRRGVSFSRKC
jgi:hypothetical protein